MKRFFIYFFLILSSFGCGKQEGASPEVEATPCVSGNENLRRKGSLVKREAAFLVGSTIHWPRFANDSKPDFSMRTSMAPCNLPPKYRGDTSRVYISGYFLSSPMLELINIAPLPFELTDLELRE